MSFTSGEKSLNWLLPLLVGRSCNSVVKHIDMLKAFPVKESQAAYLCLKSLKMVARQSN